MAFGEDGVKYNMSDKNQFLAKDIHLLQLFFTMPILTCARPAIVNAFLILGKEVFFV